MGALHGREIHDPDVQPAVDRVLGAEKVEERIDLVQMAIEPLARAQSASSIDRLFKLLAVDVTPIG